MVLRINKIDCIHKILIYILLIFNQSSLYSYFLNGEIINYITFGVVLVLLLYKFKSEYNKYLIISGILLMLTTLTRILVGGIGINAWISWSLPILFCVYVIKFDINNFLTRFVKVVVFLSAVGIVFFVIQVMMPDLLKQILFINYDTAFSQNIWTDSLNYTTIYDEGYGLFLYSFRDGGDALTRNKGIFTEPGIAQMVYISAVFILLFMRDKITNINVNRSVIILIISIITVQSTSGYIALAVMLLVYVLTNQKKGINLKKNIITFTFSALLLLVIDFSIREGESFIYTSVISKLFSDTGNFEIQDSGQYRIGAILLSLTSMLENPLGIGSDNFTVLLHGDDTAGGGAGILKYGAINGVLSLVVCLCLYFVPIFKYKFKLTFKLLLAFILINVLLAQTGPFYPVLLIFPIYFIETYYGKNSSKIILNQEYD